MQHCSNQVLSIQWSTGICVMTNETTKKKKSSASRCVKNMNYLQIANIVMINVFKTLKYPGKTHLRLILRYIINVRDASGWELFLSVHVQWRYYCALCLAAVNRRLQWCGQIGGGTFQFANAPLCEIIGNSLHIDTSSHRAGRSWLLTEGVDLCHLGGIANCLG